MEKVKALLLDIVQGIVDRPEAVELHITEENDDRGEIIIVNVKLARQDVGMCIGQKGSTADAIRRVIGLAGFKQTGKRIYVKIDAPKIPKNHFDYQSSQPIA